MFDEAAIADGHWDDIGDEPNPLPLIQKWYAKQCNGDWEHSSGIEITTLDNPGWRVKIDLNGTILEGKAFPRIATNVDPAHKPTADSWMCCFVENATWNGAGDPRKLNIILMEFLHWAADVAPCWPDSTKSP